MVLDAAIVLAGAVASYAAMKYGRKILKWVQMNGSDVTYYIERTLQNGAGLAVQPVESGAFHALARRLSSGIKHEQTPGTIYVLGFDSTGKRSIIKALSGSEIPPKVSSSSASTNVSWDALGVKLVYVPKDTLLTELPDYMNSLVIVALQSYVTKYVVDLAKKCLEDRVPAIFVRSQCDRYLYDMLAEGDIDEVNQASADKFVAMFKENLRKQLHAADSRLLGYPLFMVSSKSLRNSVAEEAPSSGVYFEDKKFLDFVASWMWSDEVGREADLD